MAKVAAIQMASGPNIKANLLQAEQLICEAAQAGAMLIVLPENFAFVGASEIEKLEFAEDQGDGPMQHFLSQQSRRFGIWIVGGTIPVKTENPDKVRAACLVYSSDGTVYARYDKMHLFDVQIPDSYDNYRESEAIEPGDNPVQVETPVGRVALSVCYDLRFPEYFRALIDEGVDIITVPAAFTAETGKAHWELLLRTRAVENLSFVIAAAQGGYHVNSRETWGHSMIIDPWGNILGCQKRGSGIVVADIQLEQQENLRKVFPVLNHRRIA